MFYSQRTDVLSDVALANVEALAVGESAGDIHCPFGGGMVVLLFILMVHLKLFGANLPMNINNK